MLPRLAAVQAGLPLILLTTSSLLLSMLKVVHSQGANVPAVSTAAPVNSTAETTTEDTCSKHETPSPITINTYGGCSGGSSDTGDKAGSVELNELIEKTRGLSERLSTVEAYVNTLIANGGSSGTGGTSGTGGSLPILVADESRFIDCSDHFKNGSTANGPYRIWPLGTVRSIEVFCEFKNNNGYTVIQERSSAQVSFQRNWQEYKRGFGKMNTGKDFWLGLENIYALTRQREMSLRIDLQDWNGNMRNARYESFQISSEPYQLKVFFFDTQQSTAGDSFSNYHNFLPFSTFDNDNDYAGQNCAEEHGGGWWFRDCDNSQLNGIWTSINVDRNGLDYNKGETGIEWDSWLQNYSLRGAKMSIAPRWV